VSPPLVAVAHGSRDPAATAATLALLDAVRRDRPGLEVLGCFLDHASPALLDVLAAVPAEPVVVPLLLSAGYHSRVDIPAAVAASARPVRQAAVLGPDPRLLDAMERRLTEAGVVARDPSTAVVLAAAGSSDPDAIASVTDVAAEWARRGWWSVEPAFASAAEPTVHDAVAGLRARGAPRVVVASYLLFPGVFAEAVAAVGADATGAPMGDAPEVVRLVLARYDQGRGDRG
jgi:sirohydrochlorin ferrochelatase